MKAGGTRLLLPIFCAVFAFFITARFILAALPDYVSFGDLPQYYAAARMIVEGHGSSIFTPPYLGPTEEKFFPGITRHIVTFTPPFALPVLVPIALLPQDSPEQLWTLLEALAIGSGIFALKRAFNISWYSFFWWLGLLALSAPVYETIRIGQITGFVFLFFSLALMFLKKDRPILAGLFLSLMLVKAQQVVPFLVFLLGAGRYKVLASFTGFSVVLSIISVFMIGIDGYLAYITCVRDGIVNNQLGVTLEITTTLRGQLARVLPQHTGIISLVTVLIWIAFMVWLFKLARQYGRRENWLVYAVLLSMPLGLILGPHIHIYDTLMFAPSLMALQASGLMQRVPDWVKICFVPAMALFHSSPYSAIHYLYMLRGGPINPFFWTLMALSCFMVWLVLARADTAPLPEMSAVPEPESGQPGSAG